MIKVIHIKNTPKDWKDNPDFVYIGRPGKGETSLYGNPFRMSEFTTREEVIERYRNWFLKSIEIDDQFKQQILQLKDKTLVCFCREIDTPELETVCHGDVIADYVNSIK